MYSIIFFYYLHICIQFLQNWHSISLIAYTNAHDFHATCNMDMLHTLLLNCCANTQNRAGSNESHITYEVETSRCQPLGQMCGKQKACEESQKYVIKVERVYFICSAAFSHAQEDLDKTQICIAVKRCSTFSLKV